MYRSTFGFAALPLFFLAGVGIDYSIDRMSVYIAMVLLVFYTTRLILQVMNGTTACQIPLTTFSFWSNTDGQCLKSVGNLFCNSLLMVVVAHVILAEVIVAEAGAAL